MNDQHESSRSEEFDYIVVGSGAGGGPLAARLALRGFRVLVVEAGAGAVPGSSPPAAPEISLVPGLHAASTEDDALSWRFFVDHYDDPPAGEDPKRHVPEPGEGPDRAGIFYPRAAAVGGCTVHNAMITIAGPDSDWDELAEFLGDDGWRAERMRAYFQRMEHNDELKPPGPIPRNVFRRGYEAVRWLLGYDLDLARGKHGFFGWLHTSVLDLELGLGDRQLVKMLKAALWKAKQDGLDQAYTLASTFLRGNIKQYLDPNHATTQAESPEGVVLVPTAVCGSRTTIHEDSATPEVRRGRRSSPRAFLLEVQASHPDLLKIRTDCLVTRVLFDSVPGGPPRAVGVELLQGARLYRAHRIPSAEPGEVERVFVKDGGEVVLCGGSFNTPQLLMLSGIGDAASLAATADEAGDPWLCSLRGRDSGPISANEAPFRVNSPGVGRNLQDRYEVTLVSRMKRELAIRMNARYKLPKDGEEPDPHLKEWRREGTGLYATNGVALAILKRSRPELPQPDLFIFGVPATFRGYEVGYSDVGEERDTFTWTILKSHTSNNGGAVRLRSVDPRDTPIINFHYFNEKKRPGESANDPDLLALVEGVKFVRGIIRNARAVVREEVHPGAATAPEGNDAKIKNWILRDAWGHHACGTCRMGPEGDENAVVDSRFRVRGVGGLRVVDASIFPNIPGYFIVTNLYMASEKAADVLAEDALGTRETTPEYPRELREVEAEALRIRRGRIGADPPSGSPAPADPALDPTTWADDVTGLALSGGGVRSATFGLGVLQGLAAGRSLRRIDFLSTVSGGGYIGAFLGRFYDQLRVDPLRGGGASPSPSPAARVERELNAPDSKSVEWLRTQSNYLAPAGLIDARNDFAVFVRNLLSVYFVVGALTFAVFGLTAAVRYGLLDPASAGLGLIGIDAGELPLGRFVRAFVGPFYSPWHVVFELLVLYLVLPRGVGYWLVADDPRQRFHGPALLLLFLTASSLVVLGVRDGLDLAPLLLGLALFSTFWHVELAWRRGRMREKALGAGDASTQRLRARNLITDDLGFAVALAAAALGFTIVDEIGHGLQQYATGNQAYARAFSMLLATAAILIMVYRWVANQLARRSESGCSSPAGRTFGGQVVAGLFAASLVLVPLVICSFTAHVVYQGGGAVRQGLWATLGSLVVALIASHPKAISFVNRSSLATTYAARLARTYLGASNPVRRRPDGADVTEVVPGDDVGTIVDYRPHEAGGPIHLINLVVNQTVDFHSGRGNRDRKGEGLVVSPLSISIGKHWHAAWNANIDADPPVVGVLGAKPLGRPPGGEHPLIDASARPADRMESLSLRQWIALSGAYLDPGRAQSTRLGTSLLFGATNLRTGYWWDSGIPLAARSGRPRLSFLRRLVYLTPSLFRTQALLLSEWIARYPGPWDRYWHLADGGHFDVLGCYELIRRRTPRIIAVDASSDLKFRFDGLAELVRKVRIDFDAHVEPFTSLELDQLETGGVVPPEVRRLIGDLDDLAPHEGASAKHAALFRVHYGSGPEPRRPSILLYLKATTTGDEGMDVASYQAARPDFPNESTSDQFFDEAQWECYRRLGSHIATPLFENPAWFWAVTR